MKSIMADALTMLALATTTAGAAEVDHYSANNMLVYCKAFMAKGKRRTPSPLPTATV
jgi:hypothetical protein